MPVSSSNGFYYKRNINAVLDAPDPLQVRLADSVTLTIGQMVRINTSGYAAIGSISGPVLGVCVGFADDNGINPYSLIYDTSVANVTLAGTNGANDKITASSNNQTNSHYMLAMVAIDPGGSILYQNKTNGTLTQANVGQFANLTATADQVDTATFSDTTGVVQCLAINPNGDDATVGLFRIATSQLLSQVGNSTAVRSA